MPKPKPITTTATIKAVTLTPPANDKGKGFIKVAFEGLLFSRSQEEPITKWMDGKEELLITLEPTQKKLPGTE